MWMVAVLVGLLAGGGGASTEAGQAPSAQIKPAQATKVCTLKVSGMT